MKIGVFGATGLIGRTFIKLLENVSLNHQYFFFASKKSQGKIITLKNKEYKVEALSNSSFKNLDVAFLFLPNEITFSLKEQAKKYHVKVIDNSSVFRMKRNVPLVIDDINGELAYAYDYIANPNCTTIQNVLPLYYLDKLFSLKEINYITYQSLSGGGNKLLIKHLKSPIFESTYPFIGEIKNGYSLEENKMINETQKILSKKIKIRAFCVRTSAEYVHGCYVDCIFAEDIDINKIKKAFLNTRVHLSDKIIPQKGRNDILVVRLRKDLYDNKRLQFYTLADNLLVGASYNSYLIGKRLNIFD